MASRKYTSFRIEERQVALVAVFKLSTPHTWIDGTVYDEIACNERTLGTRVYFGQRNGRDVTMERDALSALQAAKEKPRDPHA